MAYNDTTQAQGNAANDSDKAAGGQETSGEQTGAPISPEVIKPEEWKGNPLYFQEGKKAGTLKPAGRAKAAKDATQFDGLNLDALKASNPGAALPPAPQAAPGAPDKKSAKAEKKLVEATIASKLVMRALDTIVDLISGGTYGADFTPQQATARNKYREEMEKNWQDYLVTLDVPMHPAIVVFIGSGLYIAPALETAKGKERVQSLREKIVSKIAVGIFRKAKG